MTADPIGERIRAGAFVVLDKPRGPSSHQVTAWARDLLEVPTAGHAGTLDPNVSGVLWVGVGPALKLLPLVLELPKRYIGAVAFHGPVERRSLAALLEEFTGPIYQTPPVRSAVKRERRVRTIHRLVLHELEAGHAVIEVVCESGTYIRTLAVDLGEALGVGAHLEELRRLATGPFDERKAVPLTTLADARASQRAGDPGPLLALLHPLDELLAEFPTIVVKDAAAAAVAHGAGLAAAGIVSSSRPFARDARVVLRNRAGELIATGRTRYGSEEVGSVRHGWVVEETRVFADPTRFPALWHRPRAAGPAAETSPSG
jgi:H/ACA ribonucleoprotein complex subunit 4